MKSVLIFFVFAQLVAQAQPKTKQVLVEGSGPPIVLLNGGTFDMTAFAPHSKLLADSFTIIRMQQFNIQYADEGLQLPNNYSVKTESEAIPTTLDSLHIKGPIIIAGHSYGGVIAFDFALRHPDKVSALILIEPPLFDLAEARGKLSTSAKEMKQFILQLKPETAIIEDLVKGFRCQMMNCDTINIYQHPMWAKWVKQKDRLKGMSAVPAYTVDFKKLHDFKKPVLIITASETVAFNKTVDSLLTKELAYAKTATFTGDHIAVYRNAERFVRLVKTFLSATINTASAKNHPHTKSKYKHVI